jgi:adenosyl cobinamide kinase/adenosyl cobinamide phosphate guanylyltransferase
VLTLLLGGARSGKSELAESMCVGDDVAYVATGEATDDDMSARIAAHKLRRPPAWTTLECGPDLIGAIRAIDAHRTVLVDSLGTWVARTDGFAADGVALAEALRCRTGTTVVVSEEVGLGVHPETEVGRLWRDALGDVNRAVAGVADEVLLVIAGRTIVL